MPNGDVVGLAQTISLILSGAFVAYLIAIVVPFARHKPAPVGDPEVFSWHLFVPCRDEEAVIGETLDYLRDTLPAAEVWVIDDDSDDGTVEIVTRRAESDPGVHLVRRHRPNARTGKGDALNTGYEALQRTLGPRVDRERVVVGVFDADGRPAGNCLEVVAADQLFGDPKTGGVQIEVRMLNRHDRRPLPGRGRWRNAFGSVLVQLQDLEFRTVIAAIQLARRHTRTVGMGGNGQFTRLSALDRVAEGYDAPWHGSLLEDFELGIHLMIAGWRTSFSADTWVDQEGLPQLSRFIVQRTRWGQGVMQCSRYLRETWDSPHISHAGAIEIGYYLLQPWLALLGTLVYPIPFIVFFYHVASQPQAMESFLTGWGGVLVGSYFVFGLGMFGIWGPLYRRYCEPTMTRRHAVVLGFAYLVYVYGFYFTSWRAAYRLARRRHGWAKTRRNSEVILSGPVAKEA